jgi:hypothetical protein
MSRRALPTRGSAGSREPSATLARKCDCGNHAPGGTCSSCAEEQKKRRVSRFADRTAPDTSSHPASADRSGHGDHAAQADNAVPSIVHDVLRGGGERLPGDVRAFMEPRFGADFSDVRLHTDGQAAQSSRAVQAQAYTAGPHIVFGAGRYQPSTPAGQRLLAHELTHVVQQRGAGTASLEPPRTLGDPADASEREADATADRALARTATLPAAAPGIDTHATGVQRALSLGEGLGIGAGVLGGIGLGLGIAALAGAFDKEHFSTDDLVKYLDGLAERGAPERARISDNKARDVVRHWLAKDAQIDVDAGHNAKRGSLSSIELKRLLILEMLDGVTGNADERQIIAILDRSTPGDVVQIFDPAKGLAVQDVNTKVGGREHSRLMAILEEKFPAASAVRAQQPVGSACNARDALMVFHARQRAMEEVEHAIGMLATPDAPAVQAALACHFKGASATDVARIRRVFERIRNELPTRKYYCVRGLSSFDFPSDDGKTRTAECLEEDAATLSIPAAEGAETSRTAGAEVVLCDKFFGRTGESQATTIIHESGHAAGLDVDLQYNPPCGYALASALDNPDSYAQFASDLFARRDAAATMPASAPASAPASGPASGPSSAPASKTPRGSHE